MNGQNRVIPSEYYKNKNKRMEYVSNHRKIVYYYLAIVSVFLIFLKLLASDFFKDAVNFAITFLPFGIIFFLSFYSFYLYQKHPERKDQITKHTLVTILQMLFVTLIFYVLYSPASFAPVLESFVNFQRRIKIDTYFFLLACVSVLVVAFSIIFFFYRLYQKSAGKYFGSIDLLLRHSLETVFIILFLLLGTSVLAYPNAYNPITDFASDAIYTVSFGRIDVGNPDLTNSRRITSLKRLTDSLSQTYANLANSVSGTSKDLATTIAETKEKLDSSITRTNKDLKNTLTNDITDRLDTGGGTVDGKLVVEKTLTVNSLSNLQDVIPQTDDTYDLGSVSKGWDNIYVHRLIGSSIITIGDGSTSHGMTSTDALLVSGNLEANSLVYLDAGADLGGQNIIDLAEPVNNSDAATKYYVDNYLVAASFIQRNNSTSTLYPLNSGDSLDMLNAKILNIGAAGTDFTDTGGLTLAGGLTTSGIISATSGSAHTIGSITITGNVIAGLPNTPTAADQATSKTYVDTQVAGAGYQSGSGTNLDMSNGGSTYGLITNIGDANTDFTSGGGLTLAGVLNAASGSAHTLGSLSITAGAVTGLTSLNASISSTELGYLDGVTSAIQTQFSNNINQAVLTSSSPSFVGLTLSGGNLVLGSNTLTTSDTGLVSNLNADRLDSQEGSYYRDADNINAGTLAVGRGGTGTSTGSITGTGALIFAAGGTAQNITLTPSTTGYTILGGNVGIGNTGPVSKLDVLGSGRITASSSALLTGTVDPDGTTTLVGSGTLFLSELVVGDLITTSGGPDLVYVTDIASNTSLTTNISISNYTAGKTITKYPASFTVRDSSYRTAFSVSNTGYVGVGMPTPSFGLEVAPITGSGAGEIVATGYGSSSPGNFMGRHANGTQAIPTAASSGDALLVFGGRGYGTTGFPSGHSARIAFFAAENYTDSARGAYIQFQTTPNLSTTLAERMRIDQNGYVGIGDTTPAALLTVGNNDLFQVNSSGAIAAVVGITNTGAYSQTGTGTFGTGTGAVSLNGDTTIATGKNLALVSGTGTFAQTYTGTSDAMTIISSGTTDAKSALNISQTGATTGTDYGLYLTNTGAGTTNVGGYFSASGATNNYGLLVAAGNVGIGTTTPTNILSLGGDSARTIGMERHTTSNTAGNNLTIQAGGATSGATNKNGGGLIISGGTSTGSGSSIITFQTAAAGATGTTDRSPATRMTIAGSGRTDLDTVLAGTSADTGFDLGVTFPTLASDPGNITNYGLTSNITYNQNISLANTSPLANIASLWFQSNIGSTFASGKTINKVVGAGGIISMGGAGTITNAWGLYADMFQTAGTITGNHSFHSAPVFMGGTSTYLVGYYAANAYKIDGGGTINNQYGVYVEPMTSGTANYGVYIESSISGTTGNALYIYNTGTNDSILDDSGAKLTAVGVWTDASDASKKKEVKNLSYGLSDLLKLRPVNYIWKLNDQSDIGFIAQELKEIIPEVVYGEDGNMSVSYSHLTALAVKSIQEQQIQISGITDNQETITKDITTLNLKTDTNVTTIEGLQDSIDEQFLKISNSENLISKDVKDISNNLKDYNLRIADLETNSVKYENGITVLETLTTALQSQIDELQKNVDAALLSEIDTNYKMLMTVLNTDKDGNVNILGNITAQKIVVNGIETGEITIIISDKDKKTIGEATITIDGTVDSDGNSSDGKSVIIKTMAVDDNSKIYLTPLKSTNNQVLYVGKIKSKESFEVKVDDAVKEDIKFNWWIVSSR
jgi:hypothetical protein